MKSAIDSQNSVEVENLKAEFNKGILTLRAEDDEEKEFLDEAFKEGLRAFGGGSYMTVCLPSLANLIQFHIAKDDFELLKRIFNKIEKPRVLK